MTQKRLDFEPETAIAAAFGVEESLALARWSFQRRVVEPLDLAPAFGVHGLVVGGGILYLTFFSVVPDDGRKRLPSDSHAKATARAAAQ